MLRINTFLAEVKPEDYKQGYDGTVSPPIVSAKAASYGYLIKNARNPDTAESFYVVWEENLIEEFYKFADKTKHVRFELLTTAGILKAFSDDIQADLALISIAIVLVAIYTILVLGTFSAMHCRLVVSIAGLVCVGIAYASGFGIVFYCGGETAGVHNLMPFLLIGIGVDDMFVICNALDQTDLKASAAERIREAIKHAGPSITITSLTNTLAFAFGALNSLTALRSFCVFASICILMLYLVVMTVFLSVVVWDTRRVANKKGECCGLFMCKLYSVFCCKGFFLSKKMIKYGDVNTAADGQKDQQQDAGANV